METDKFLEQSTDFYFHFEIRDHVNMNSAIVSQQTFPLVFTEGNTGEVTQLQ